MGHRADSKSLRYCSRFQPIPVDSDTQLNAKAPPAMRLAPALQGYYVEVEVELGRTLGHRADAERLIWA